MTVRIVIDETVETDDDVPVLLEHIAELIEGGCNRGFYPHWHLEDV